MTYTELDESQFVPGGEIKIDSFGQVIHDNFEDHNSRIVACENDVSNLGNIASALLDQGRWYWHGDGTSDSAVVLDATGVTKTFILKLFDSTETIPNNISFSSSTGLFTVANSGTYSISFSVTLMRSDSGGSGVLAGAYIGKWSGTDSDTSNRRWTFPFLPVAAGVGQVAPLTGSAQAVPMTAGSTFGLYLIGTGGQFKLHEPWWRSANLGIQRTG